MAVLSFTGMAAEPLASDKDIATSSGELEVSNAS